MNTVELSKKVISNFGKEVSCEDEETVKNLVGFELSIPMLRMIGNDLYYEQQRRYDLLQAIQDPALKVFISNQYYGINCFGKIFFAEDRI